MASQLQNLQGAIHTPRLTLSPYDPNNDTHCDFLAGLHNSPEVRLANGDVPTVMLDRESARRNIAENHAGRLRTGFGRFIITLNAPPSHSTSTSTSEGKTEPEPGPVFIGNVGLKLRRLGATVPDIGFAFLRPYWGHGYATEACTALLQYFQKEKGVNDVLGYCSPVNENSKKMFRRLGFEDRGVRTVSGLGPEEEIVVKALVWAKPGMDSDLGVYGIKE